MKIPQYTGILRLKKTRKRRSRRDSNAQPTDTCPLQGIRSQHVMLSTASIVCTWYHRLCTRFAPETGKTTHIHLADTRLRCKSIPRKDRYISVPPLLTCWSLTSSLAIWQGRFHSITRKGDLEERENYIRGIL